MTNKTEKHLSTEAKWLIIKFIGVFVLGAWAIIFGVSWVFTESLHQAALAEVKQRVAERISEERALYQTKLDIVESGASRISKLTDDTITEFASARSSAASAKYSLASTRIVSSEFEEIGKNILAAQATIKFLDEAKNDFKKLTDTVANSEELQDAVSAKIEDVPIGTVVASMLSPREMDTMYGSKWVPADGRHINQSSRYAASTGKSTVPDMRGMFIRGLNYSFPDQIRSDGFADPDGAKRNPGDLQMDEFKSHSHKIGASPASHFSAGDSGGPRTSTARESTTSPVGGKETRPINVSMYYYIKIN